MLLLMTFITGNSYALNDRSIPPVTSENIGNVHNEGMDWVHRKLIILNRFISVDTIKKNDLWDSSVAKYYSDFLEQKGVGNKKRVLRMIYQVEEMSENGIPFITQQEELFYYQLISMIDEKRSTRITVRKIKRLVRKYRSMTDDEQFMRIRLVAEVAKKSFEYWSNTTLTFYKDFNNGSGQLAEKDVVEQDVLGAAAGAAVGAVFGGKDGAVFGAIVAGGYFSIKAAKENKDNQESKPK